jgi:hypothetical protein
MATRTCTCKLRNSCAERRHFKFFCLVWSVHFKTRYFRLWLEFSHELKNIGFGVKRRKESSNKWKPILKWRWNNYVTVTNTMWFMITGALLAQICLFGFSLRFNYSKTPIYRAFRGKGKKPGKAGDTVNRGTGKSTKIQPTSGLKWSILRCSYIH